MANDFCGIEFIDEDSHIYSPSTITAKNSSVNQPKKSPLNALKSTVSNGVHHHNKTSPMTVSPIIVHNNSSSLNNNLNLQTNFPSNNNGQISSTSNNHLQKNNIKQQNNAQHQLLNMSISSRNSASINPNLNSNNDEHLQFDDPIGTTGGGSESPSPSHDGNLLDSAIDSSLLSFRFHMVSFFMALLFLVVGVIFNLTVLAIIHERVPFDQPPLPDVSFDLLPKHDVALDISEYIIMFMSTSVIVMIFCHQYRWIILSRLSIILGLLYMFRAVCMAVTQVPVSNPQYYCSPRLNVTEMNNSWHLFKTVLWRVMYLSVGLGMSINGHHTYCGDYIFSGHTVILIISNHFLFYYWLSSHRKALYILIRCCYHFLVIAGIVSILIARGHYMVDVVLALVISHVIFYSYHTLCHYALLHHAQRVKLTRQQQMLDRNSYNTESNSANVSNVTSPSYLSQQLTESTPIDTWWCYYIFKFFEKNTIEYQIIIRNEFQWPWMMFASKRRQMMIII